MGERFINTFTRVEGGSLFGLASALQFWGFSWLHATQEKEGGICTRRGKLAWSDVRIMDNNTWQAKEDNWLFYH